MTLDIAVVAPPWLPVPPRGYGGIEALVADMVAELSARGHQVTLLSVGWDEGDELPDVTTLPASDEARIDEIGDELPAVAHAAEALATVEEMRPDVVHDHTTAFGLGAAGLECPVVVTAHGPVLGDLRRYLRAVGRHCAPVAISESQRGEAPGVPWYATVHNGIVVDPVPFHDRPAGDHVAFIGRMSPDKGVHVAIDLAHRAGRRIAVAGKCNEPAELEYFEEMVRPRLGADDEWLGEVGGTDKFDLLGEATCLLFPLQWDEPFGLVMIEAMACGTPVLSLARGAVPEVVVDGVTGFERDKTDDLLPCLDRLDEISRSACREHVATTYSIERTVDGYERVYESLVARRRGAG
jgi:glycosyltransferase involved in cell wall biosynthesis